MTYLAAKAQLSYYENLKKQHLRELFNCELKIVEYTRAVEKSEPKTLEATEHAIERFRTRGMNLPKPKVRKLLEDPKLLEKYQALGEGRYKIPALSYMTAVIKDYKVITCFNQHDPLEQLTVLEHYMDYFIEGKTKQYLGEETKVDKFRQFKAQYFK